MSSRVVINEAARVVTTTLPGGATVTAVPNEDEESVARARALGYRHANDRDVVWAMTRDHDPLHVLVADALGEEASASLRIATAGDATPELRARADLEERVVLLIQRLLNVGIRECLNARTGELL